MGAGESIVNRYPFVAIDVDPEEADAASGLLFELGAQGVEERDATTLVKSAVPGKVTLVASFADYDEAHAAIVELARDHEEHSPRLEEIVGDEWRDAWKRHFRPFVLCEGVIVRPPWQEVHVLELEPGRAFGTGLHETTSLVAEAMAERRGSVRGATVLDVGCGSGILALTALVLGASRARAIDVDADVVDVVRENAVRNRLADRVEVDTTPVEDLPGEYAVVLANIEAEVLVRLARAITAKVAAGGLLVLSGVLVPQKGRVLSAYTALGLELVDAPEKGEWIAIVLARA
jgi:ribosomal protein L11 methyltransferase